MRLLGIDHVQLGMPAGGEDAARYFYVDVLGLHEVPKPPPLAGRGGLWLAGPDVAVHVGVEHEFRPADRAHPAFIVDGLAALRTRLEQADIEITEDDSGLPVERCYVRDPFGNRIELVEAASAGFSSG